MELEAYRDSEVELNSYSVLVPKSDAAEKVFGTYNGTTFYYTTTSEAEYRKEVKKHLKIVIMILIGMHGLSERLM
ncbi:hypothetical protein [Intestinimonas timonensis]|uniref:hypothetical protein n=1 Tax=Intestinimonas timonensis TaxID=1689270 RepID=UPI00102FD96B|nr:hypothetical protein [Intestinimonas timonensis]